MAEIESQLSNEKTRRMSDAEEWKQFQADLLMTVRVANDFQVIFTDKCCQHVLHDHQGY